MRSRACLAALYLLLAAPAFAVSYMPLATGMTWDYTSPSAGPHNMMMCGTRVVHGVVTSVRHQSEAAQVYENYWSDDADGTLYLHGAWNVTHDFKAVYVPPIVFLQPPLAVGRTWANPHIQVEDFEGNPAGDPFSYPMAVFEDVVLTVPAGSFHCYGVGFDAGGFTARAGTMTFTATGRRIDAGTTPASVGSATDWFSEGVGEVRFAGGADVYDLVGWGAPTDTRPATWGAIKALFSARLR